MKKNLKYMILEYTESDLEYIDFLIQKLDDMSEEIVNFFGISEFRRPVYVVLNNSLEVYREKYMKTGFRLEPDGTVPRWSCGFALGNIVETLCLSEYSKTKTTKEVTVSDLLHLILHEFTHACHNEMTNVRGCYRWLSEGLATTLSHQHDNSELIFNDSLAKMCEGKTDYRNYHTMFKYVLETYGREYILELIKNSELLIEETPRLYSEVEKKYSCTK